MEGDVVQMGTSQTGVSCGCVTCLCASRVTLEQMAGPPVTEILLAFRDCEFNQRQTKEGINKKPFFLFSCVPPTSDLSEKIAKSLFLLTYQLCSKPHKHYSLVIGHPC